MAEPVRAVTPPAGPAGSIDLLARARGLAPTISAQAAANEASGKLVPDVVAALRNEVDFFGMWVPEALGGYELWPVETLEILETLCRADGSTGWVVMATLVASGSAGAYLEPSAAREIFGGRIAIIAGQGAPNGKAEIVDGGFRLSGKWSYGSGLPHADYVHTGGVVFENGAPRLTPGTGQPEFRIFILPVGQARLLGNWDVMGLRATGSVDYAIDGAFVPREYTHIQSTKKPRTGGAFFKLGIQSMGSICHTGFALGTARRALDELATLARAEAGRPSLIQPRGGGESFHEHFGTMEAKLRAARALAFETYADIEATLKRGDELATRQATMARLQLNHVTQVGAEVCSFVFRWAGGVALHDGVLQRVFRDMQAGAQHVTTSPIILRECAKDLLGLAPGKVWGPRSLVDPD